MNVIACRNVREQRRLPRFQVPRNGNDEDMQPSLHLYTMYESGRRVMMGCEMTT